MLRILAKLTLLAVLFFTSLFLVARTLGSTQPSNPALAGFSEGCEGESRLCWYGIVPGVTTVQQANSIMKARNYTIEADGAFEGPEIFTSSDPAKACRFNLYFHDTSIEQVAILTCGKVHLGELTPVFGVPRTITGLGIVIFEDKQIWAELPFTNDKHCWNVAPESEISVVRLIPQQTIDTTYDYFQHIPTADWTGLLSFDGYTRLYHLECKPGI